jgi:hypothetical protein
MTIRPAWEREASAHRSSVRAYNGSVHGEMHRRSRPGRMPSDVLGDAAIDLGGRGGRPAVNAPLTGPFAMRMRGLEPPQSHLHTGLNRIDGA